VDRGEEYVVALIEDVLGAVAVVVVDIEDGHPGAALVKEGLGGNRGIVQVAVAAHDFSSGVVPWWAAQSEGRVSTLLDGSLGGQGDLRGAVGGLPRTSGDRRAGVEAVVAQFAMQAGWLDLAQGACRPGEGQQVTVVTERGPARPGALEEVEIVGAVNALQRRTAEISWPLDIAEVALFHLFEDVVGA